MQAPLPIKDQLTAHLTLIMTTLDSSSLKNSLVLIKSLVSQMDHQDEVALFLLSEGSNAVPLLALTLAFADLSPVSIAILLALSFHQPQID
jgi:Na+/pantothenate symporter